VTDDRQTDHAMGKCVAIGRIAYTSRVILCGKVDRNKKKFITFHTCVCREAPNRWICTKFGKCEKLGISIVATTVMNSELDYFYTVPHILF